MTVTIGIPTYVSQKILIETIKSIYFQSYFSYVSEIIIAVDGISKANLFLKHLDHKKLRVLFYKKRAGQSQRLNDIFKESSSDLLVLTNDDVIWDKDALKNLVESFRKNESDLLSGTVLPFPSQTLFEKLVEIGFLLNKKISHSYKKGNNYLTCNGRLIALSKKFYKQINIPPHVWNNDAFIFICAKLNEYRYSVVRKSVGYYRSPSTFREHFKQSKKFLHSYEENQKEFKKNIAYLYTIPVSLVVRSLTAIFIKKPVLTSAYVMITILIRLWPSSKDNYKKSFWETDMSTKKLYTS